MSTTTNIFERISAKINLNKLGTEEFANEVLTKSLNTYTEKLEDLIENFKDEKEILEEELKELQNKTSSVSNRLRLEKEVKKAKKELAKKRVEYLEYYEQEIANDIINKVNDDRPLTKWISLSTGGTITELLAFETTVKTKEEALENLSICPLSVSKKEKIKEVNSSITELEDLLSKAKLLFINPNAMKVPSKEESKSKSETKEE